MEFGRLLIFAGAGISKESGLPLFRDVDGLWEKFDVAKVCEYRNFLQNKENTEYRKNLFNFYNEVKREIDKAKPSVAHQIVARIQEKYGSNAVKIFTSNIDDLFEKAGCKNVVHVHGDISFQECVACAHSWKISTVFEDIRCPKCNSRLTKPSVVFFNEAAPLYSKLKKNFDVKNRKTSDVLLYIGSSQTVITPEFLFGTKFKQIKGTAICINPVQGPEDHLFTKTIYDTASNALAELFKNDLN